MVRFAGYAGKEFRSTKKFGLPLMQCASRQILFKSEWERPWKQELTIKCQHLFVALSQRGTLKKRK